MRTTGLAVLMACAALSIFAAAPDMWPAQAPIPPLPAEKSGMTPAALLLLGGLGGLAMLKRKGDGG